VVPTLSAWKSAGKTLAIFSSGSVQAQLQFFSYVKDGPMTTRDIKPLFSAHYDTVNGGPKLEKTSYEKICSEIGKDASKVTFLTDNVKGTLTLAAHTFYLKQHTHSPHRLDLPRYTPLCQMSFDCPIKPIIGHVTRFISDEGVRFPLLGHACICTFYMTQPHPSFIPVLRSVINNSTNIFIHRSRSCH
jgi:hypothetical protein